jgi:hypothetical protein
VREVVVGADEYLKLVDDQEQPRYALQRMSLPVGGEMRLAGRPE